MYNILCIESNIGNHLAFETLVEAHLESYDIVKANGTSNLIDMIDNNIDLVIIDEILDGTDGFEIAKQIKENYKDKDLQIIFLIDNKTHEIIEKVFKYGVDYLEKPYDEFELVSKILHHQKLNEYHHQLDEQISFNQAVLDSQTNIIFIRDDTKILSVNQSFLKFFMVNSLDEFLQRHACVSELFMEYENYFTLDVLNQGHKWISELNNHKDEEYCVLLMDINKFEPKSFRIDVNQIKYTDKFVVTLIDITQLTTISKKYEVQATHDNLTGVYNRNKFDEVFDLEVKIAKANNHHLCFAIFDIDHFKKVNDTFGHLAGDNVLKRFASIIQNYIREVDTFARWGGEEFVLALSGIDIDSALQILNSIRIQIEQSEFKTIGNLTCSIGITQLKDEDDIKDIIARADKALYSAKENGRNQVKVQL